MTIQQVIDTFKDNQFLDDIEDENSLSRKILTHKILQNTKNIVYLPYLRLLGILYCAATPKLKAESFYSVLKPNELDSKETAEKITDVHKSEVLIPEYFEKMLEIAYVMMIEVYGKSEGGEDKSNWLIDELEDIYKLIYEKFQIDVFGADQEKLTQEVFIAQFEKDNSRYLVPAHLRK